jgi:hypothetical protein
MSAIKDMDYVRYIAWQTGESFDSAFFAVTSKTVERAIGKALDITKLKIPKWVDKTKLIDTVGQRHQIENSGLSGFELLVYCLSVSQGRSNNSDVIEALQSRYLDMPFTEVLPAGFFFFKNFRDGRKRGGNCLRWLPGLTKMLSLKKRQGLTG